MRKGNIRDELHKLNYSNLTARQLSFLALFIAFTAVATFINIPGPGQSYFNLSEIAVYVVALTFGAKAGFIAGAVDPALMVLFSGIQSGLPLPLL